MAKNHFLVVVPGYMGSRLAEKASGRPLWVSLTSFPALQPDQWESWISDWISRMAWPNPLIATGVLDEIVYVPPFAKVEQYGRMFDSLASLGYRTDPKRYADVSKVNERKVDVYAFAYDWRQDNRISAQQLGEAIERWRGLNPGKDAYLVTHSNGGVVARWYLEKLGGKDRVNKHFLLGSPWDGTPKVMLTGFDGFDVFLRAGFDVANISGRSRDLFRTFPSLYQLMPVSTPFLFDTSNRPIDPFSGEGWLDDPQQRAYLADGKAFTSALGDADSVETWCYFGRKVQTLTSGVVNVLPSGAWSRIDWTYTDAGDGTIPEFSAVHPNATGRYPFLTRHGEMFFNPAIIEFMGYALSGKPTERALFVGEGVEVGFAPTRDVYAPGATIKLKARARRGPRQPAADAKLRVELRWRSALPGAATPAKPPATRRVALTPNAKRPGHFSGELVAPKVEGYYALVATTKLPKQPTIVLEELISVETPIRKSSKTSARAVF